MRDSFNRTGLADPRVLLLFPHMVVQGGALNYTLHLAQLLVQRGARVGIVTLRFDPDAVAVPAGVEVLAAGGPLTSSLLFWGGFPHWQQRLSRLIRQWEPDILVPQVFPANWWGWLYRRRHSLPLVWVCHEPSAFIHSDAWIAALRPSWKRVAAGVARPVLKRIDLGLSRSTDMAFANSRFTASELKRVYGIDAYGIAYPGIDTALFHGDETVREDAVVTVAALTRFKRIDFLIRVFARLLHHHPDLVYHVVGTGVEEDSLRRLAGELGIADRVLFRGKLAAGDLALLHRRSRLFLHGAVGEPFGLAPLEAIACGMPVVAHDSGGPAEYVDPSCGRLVQSESEDVWVSEVSGFLDYLRSEPAYFERVAASARRFSWDETLGPIVDGIALLLEDRARR